MSTSNANAVQEIEQKIDHIIQSAILILSNYSNSFLRTSLNEARELYSQLNWSTSFDNYFTDSFMETVVVCMKRHTTEFPVSLYQNVYSEMLSTLFSENLIPSYKILDEYVSIASTNLKLTRAKFESSLPNSVKEVVSQGKKNMKQKDSK